MEKLKEIMKDNAFIRRSFFIFFNAVLLCILYAVITNINIVADKITGAFGTLLDAFWPLILGLILAYLLNPLVTLVENKVLLRIVSHSKDPEKAEKRKGIRRLISVLLTYLLVLIAIVAILYGFMVMIMGRVVFTGLSSLADNVIYVVTNYEQSVRQWIADNVSSELLSDGFNKAATVIMSWISDNLSASSAISFVTGVGGSVVDVVVAVIISIYLLKDKDLFIGLWHKFLHLTLPERGQKAIGDTLCDIDDVLSKFIRGALLDSMFVAILSSIGLSILGLQGAVFIGVFAGIANIIPYFGPVIGMIPAFLMGLYTGGFGTGVLAVIILLIVQQIDSNIIYPKVVGTSTGLHPLIVLLAVSVFGYFGGILGMLLAVPTAGILQIFVIKWAAKREKALAEKDSAVPDPGDHKKENRDSGAE